LGGSIINRGGQNPLEASSYGCNIIHGPNISNFREIYSFLKKNKISTEIRNQKKMESVLDKLFTSKKDTKRFNSKLSFIGKKILNNTYKEIDSIIGK